MLLRTLLIVALGCVGLVCTAQKKGLPVKVIEATKRNWVSGAPGGRTGTKFSIKVYVNTELKTEFKNVWIGAENVPFDVEFFSLDIQKKIQNGDSLLLTYNKVNGIKNDNAEAKKLPCKYNGAALIESSIDGKVRYFIVKKFKELPSLMGM
jgi:hypothetical protein